jgi:hypothetical protein
MIIACICGRRFRIPSEGAGKNRSCPQCGGTLLPETDVLVPAVDIDMLIDQMKVLRDELVSRDRLLRKAQAEATVLRAEIEQLRSRQTVLQLPSNRVPLFTGRDP